MSMTFNELLAWSERIPAESSEEGKMLEVMVMRRENELRESIARLVSEISECENWRLSHCADVARRVEQTPKHDLEEAYRFFLRRNEGALRGSLPGTPLEPTIEPSPAVEQVNLLSASTHTSPQVGEGDVTPIEALYGRMATLEARVAPTPGMTCGLQGIRIMRVVALMSRARAAQLARVRISGTQAIYRHM